MTNIVVIPVYRRPAMLAATLRTIEASPLGCYQRYLFSIDRGAYRANDNVIDGFRCKSVSRLRRSHKFYGYTFNVLEALKSAAEQLKPSDLVYLVAEDVLVTTDFFGFHEDAHKADPAAFFVSSASRRPSPHSVNTHDSFLFRTRLETMHAVSFPVWRLESITIHATKNYYKDPIAYCNASSDALPILDVGFEGLVRRVMKEQDAYGIKPAQPRAFHVGFVGANHGGQPAIDRAFAQPRDWRRDSEKISQMNSDQLNALTDPEYRDIERGQLIRERVALRIV